MDGASTFGALLRKHRHAAGITLEQLAEASGVSGRAISDLERGFSRAPQRRTLTSIADALGLTPEDRAELRAAATSGAAAPELPRSVVDFSGRATELAQLSEHVSDDPHGPTAVAVICGQAGLGKPPSRSGRPGNCGTGFRMAAITSTCVARTRRRSPRRTRWRAYCARSALRIGRSRQIGTNAPDSSVRCCGSGAAS
ncbi:helix-turn-helix transcriptional regulator [Micromonospora sp. NPDC005215]|uniref:helix-turn-helix domain-containing protein n=1 Tax=Micromonospora sp. NPDC005215 TaxID=3157024 RepID=UPI0033B45642